ncbi:MAG: phasin family protein [Pseudomonadota bacterium]
MTDASTLVETTETLINEAQRATTDAKDALDKAAHEQVERVSANVTEITRLNQETFDAMVVSSRAAAKAVETVNAQIFAFAKRNYEEGVAAAKESLHARSLVELVEKQSGHQKAVLEDTMSEVVRLNDLVSGAMLDVMAPLSDRLQAAARLGRV